jgi:hypothetical protein
MFCDRKVNLGDTAYRGRTARKTPDKNKDVYKNLDVN